jgi:hypothetical protein
MDESGPSDKELLAAGGWADVPSAQILAKAWEDNFCAVVLDSNGAQGARPYETVEFFVREEDGRWSTIGDFGPAGTSGSGWTSGYSYEYGRSDDGWWIVVLGEDCG